MTLLVFGFTDDDEPVEIDMVQEITGLSITEIKTVSCFDVIDTDELDKC